MSGSASDRPAPSVAVSTPAAWTTRLAQRDHHALAVAVEDDVGEDREQLVEFERARQPRPGRGQDLQAPGRLLPLANRADLVGDVVEVHADAILGGRRPHVEPRVQRRVELLEGHHLPGSSARWSSG